MKPQGRKRHGGSTRAPRMLIHSYRLEQKMSSRTYSHNPMPVVMLALRRLWRMGRMGPFCSRTTLCAGNRLHSPHHVRIFDLRQRSWLMASGLLRHEGSALKRHVHDVRSSRRRGIARMSGGCGHLNQQVANKVLFMAANSQQAGWSDCRPGCH